MVHRWPQDCSWLVAVFRMVNTEEAIAYPWAPSLITRMDAWPPARHLAGTQGHSQGFGEGTLSITMLDGICNYHLHFHQRCLVTRYRQVQFSQNQDTARTYFLFLPWAEPVLNNSVFIYFPAPFVIPHPCGSLPDHMVACFSLLLHQNPSSLHLWLPVMRVFRKEQPLHVWLPGSVSCTHLDRPKGGGSTQCCVDTFWHNSYLTPYYL